MRQRRSSRGTEPLDWRYAEESPLRCSSGTLNAEFRSHNRHAALAPRQHVCGRLRRIASNVTYMKIPHSVFLAATLCLACAHALTLSSCVSSRPAYANIEGGKATGNSSVTLASGDTDYSLAFIEFGEHGSFQDPSQLQRAEELINGAGPKVLLVTFVHGWHNNSRSADVDRFRDFLGEISDHETIKGSGFAVVGVYIGWRGESLGVPVLNSLTFWNRKAAAERLASNVDCVDAIWSLTSRARAKGAGANYTVLLGHSFGGLVVERTVAHSIITGMHLPASNTLPADLIVTLNPASDSILTRQIVASLDSRLLAQNGYYVARRNSSGPVLPESRQLLVALSAQNDRATGTMFPLGSGLATIGRQFDKVAVPGPGQHAVSERRYFTTTPGNNKTLISHDVKPVDSGVAGPSTNAVDANLSLRTVSDGVFYTSNTNEPQRDGAAAVQWRRWRIARNGNARTPYWIIQVPPEIINNHGGIWSANSQALIAALFRMNFPNRGAAAVEQTPATGIAIPKSRDFNRLQSKEAPNEPTTSTP